MTAFWLLFALNLTTLTANLNQAEYGRFGIAWACQWFLFVTAMMMLPQEPGLAVWSIILMALSAIIGVISAYYLRRERRPPDPNKIPFTMDTGD